jgi:hypothetical protein
MTGENFSEFVAELGAMPSIVVDERLMPPGLVVRIAGFLSRRVAPTGRRPTGEGRAQPGDRLPETGETPYPCPGSDRAIARHRQMI